MMKVTSFEDLMQSVEQEELYVEAERLEMS